MEKNVYKFVEVDPNFVVYKVNGFEGRELLRGERLHLWQYLNEELDGGWEIVNIFQKPDSSALVFILKELKQQSRKSPQVL